MPWISIQNPSKEILDKLYIEGLKYSSEPCHDCGVKPGTVHEPGCDVARCSICKGQLLSCGCEKGEPDIWDGLWPGTKECYDKGYVSKWSEDGSLSFDYNRLAYNRD